MIRFDDVHVRYPGAAATALAGVSGEARRGQLTAIVGPNGSGKSTLVRALIGRVDLAAGAICVDGADLRSLSRREVARCIAVVAQREELTFPTTVREYVALGRYPHLGAWRSQGEADRQAIAAAVATADVTPFMDRPLDALSGGEWQRVRLARALAQGGEAIVLDEPTAFLDIGHEMAVFELLARLAAQGQAVLLVSHQLNLVARFADHMILLHDGVVAAHGPPGTVMDAATLERVYQWPLVVTRDPAVGSPTLLPLRSRHRG
jgi:iron complex transport system ATP-binding protein